MASMFPNPRMLSASAGNALQSLTGWLRKWCQNSQHDAPVAAKFLHRSSGSRS